ncbi:hypothetical protein [Flavicella sp.]|uniref:hypothetical protein n=1 Tax=Flavicella sp. TaxID=2957742 RepID=UPI003018B9D1
MNTFGKYLEIAYAIIGVFFIGEGIFSWIGNDREKAYISIGFGVLAIFMFFFKRNFRKKRS